MADQIELSELADALEEALMTATSEPFYMSGLTPSNNYYIGTIVDGELCLLELADCLQKVLQQNGWTLQQAKDGN